MTDIYNEALAVTAKWKSTHNLYWMWASTGNQLPLKHCHVNVGRASLADKLSKNLRKKPRTTTLNMCTANKIRHVW